MANRLRRWGRLGWFVALAGATWFVEACSNSSSRGSRVGGSEDPLPTGGNAPDGSALGGSATGGSASGGSGGRTFAIGGAATGGVATGGTTTGGTTTGGATTGGAAAGPEGPPSPPARGHDSLYDIPLE